MACKHFQEKNHNFNKDAKFIFIDKLTNIENYRNFDNIYIIYNICMNIYIYFNIIYYIILYNILYVYMNEKDKINSAVI